MNITIEVRQASVTHKKDFNTMIFHTNIGDSEVSHDFHDDRFTVTRSLTIVNQKL